jgi:YEATS domain-containing protein 4
VPEFTSAMEKEGDRLEEARIIVMTEQERWRTMLFDKEKELDQLQKDIDALN